MQKIVLNMQGVGKRRFVRFLGSAIGVANYIFKLNVNKMRIKFLT